MEVECVQIGIQNLKIGSIPQIRSQLKIKRDFQKKAILKQRLRDEYRIKQKLKLSEEITDDDFIPSDSSSLFNFSSNWE